VPKKSLADIERSIRFLLAEARLLLESRSFDAYGAKELIGRLSLCAEDADMVHYPYSAQVLRDVAKYLSNQLTADAPAA